MKTDGLHLAEFNIGILKYDWDDPRVADFMNNLDRVYGIAERSPGYVWHLSGDEMEAAQLDAEGVLGGNPRTASTLSVWESPEALEHFTWNTLHKQFYDRKTEWYDDAYTLLTGKGLRLEVAGDSWLRTVYRQMVRGDWL